jgi:rfaE bifunctional protein kinase chain/domain
MSVSARFASDKVTLLSEFNAMSSVELGQPVALCYGQFNVIHPGHIRYLQFARSQGASLVVALEGEETPSHKGHFRSYPALTRAESLSVLDLVDQVVILDSEGLDRLVKELNPQVLVLGKEYESESLDNDRKNKVSPAVLLMAQRQAETIYAAGETHYATDDLFRATQNELERERWDKFQDALQNQQVDIISSIKALKEKPQKRLLVVGDSIIDRYIACDPIGMSNEAPVVVVKELDAREFLGGAGIVAAHITGLGAECEFVSVVGNDQQASTVASELERYKVKSSLIQDESRPTTLKTRYLVENQKLFRVSRLKDHGLSKKIETDLIQKIDNAAPGLTGIVVSDFVYGVITAKVVDALIEISEKHKLLLFGDLQCSSQIGDVSKFSGFDLISPTEREARIALNNHDDGVEQIANLLMEKSNVSNLIVKLGAEGLIAYSNALNADTINRQPFPALAVNPIDVAGAGDSFLATMAVSLAGGLNLMEAAALGSCVSALAVQTVGNHPITFQRLEQFVKTNGGH